MPKPSFLICYGMAHFGKSLLWHCSELLFTFFLTEAAGLSPVEAAAFLSGSLYLNAAADAVLGRYLTRRFETIRQAGRLQVFGALLASAAFVAFGATGVLPSPLRPGIMILAMVIFRLSYPAVDVAQNAMLALATRCDAGRARLSSQRYIFGGSADLLVAISFAPLFLGYSPDARAWHFMLFCTAIAAIAVAGAVVLQRWLEIDPAPVVTINARNVTASPARTTSTLRWTSWIFPMIFALSLASAGFGRLVPYMAAYMLKLPANASGLVVGIVVANIMSQPVWTKLAQRTSLISLLSMAAALTMLSGMLLLASGGQDHGAYMLFIATYGAGMGGLRMALWALAAARSSALAKASFSTFGWLTAWSKCGIATGSIGAGLLLSTGDYRAATVWREALLPLVSLFPLTCGLVVLVTLHFVRQFENRRIIKSARPGSESGYI